MYIKVRVTPGAKKEVLTDLGKNRFTLSVKEKAEMNLANRRVIEVFESYFKAGGKVRIVNGHHSPSKMLSIDIPT